MQADVWLNLHYKCTSGRRSSNPYAQIKQLMMDFLDYVERFKDLNHFYDVGFMSFQQLFGSYWKRYNTKWFQKRDKYVRKGMYDGTGELKEAGVDEEGDEKGL